MRFSLGMRRAAGFCAVCDVHSFSLESGAGYLLVFIYETALCMTVQMVYVSCQLRPFSVLAGGNMWRMFAHGRRYKALPYLATLSLTKS